MDERIHAYLDGELPREALTPAELAELAAFEAHLGEAVTALRAAPVPDLTARVMAALPEPARAPEARAEPAWERLFAWLWRPRSLTLSFRPAYAFAGVAAAVLAAVYLPAAVDPSGMPIAPVAEAPAAGERPRLYVQFRLEAPEASQVRLAGSFTGWQPEHELREIAPGVWTALVPLAPGVHDYTFVVDGEEWVPDPYAPQVDDDFGGINSRLFLPPPGGHT